MEAEMEPRMVVPPKKGQKDEDMELEIARMVVPLKRNHKAEDRVEGEADGAKKMKMEPDAEEEDYEVYWDDSWWSSVDPDDEEAELSMDCEAFLARQFRDSWDGYGAGSFEAETTIPSKRFTDSDSEEARWASTLQIFAVKVTAIRGGLQWPIDVYGTVAVRDSEDYNRNTIFYRDRDNCQTLTEQDQSLVLTGPIRAVRADDRVIFDADLKVKGNIESEDKMLSFLAAEFRSQYDSYTNLSKEVYISKLSKLEFTVAYICYSVEATIDMRVTEGTWLDGFHGKFVARFDSIKDEEVVLLDSGDKKVPLDGNDISLSRCVVSVDIPGELIVSVETWQGIGKVNLSKYEKSFAAFEMSRSYGGIDVGFCKIEVTVAWSLFGSPPRRMR